MSYSRNSEMSELPKECAVVRQKWNDSFSASFDSFCELVSDI